MLSVRPMGVVRIGPANGQPPTYSIPQRTDQIWQYEVGNYTKTALEYAREKSGLSSGFGWNGLVALFGPYHAYVTIDGTGELAHYIGDGTKLVNERRYVRHRAPTGALENLRGTTWNLVTPRGVVSVAPYLLEPAVSNIRKTPAQFAEDLATLARKSAGDVAAGLTGNCPPWGVITKTQAIQLLKDPAGKFSGCLANIANLRPPPPCPTGYRRGQAMCDADRETLVIHPQRPECQKCAPKPCPDGYRRSVICDTATEQVAKHPTEQGCVKCEPRCPPGYSAQVTCNPTTEYRAAAPGRPQCFTCLPLEQPTDPGAPPPPTPPTIPPPTLPPTAPGPGEPAPEDDAGSGETPEGDTVQAGLGTGAKIGIAAAGAGLLWYLFRGDQGTQGADQ